MTDLDLDGLLVAADRAARAGGDIVRAEFGAPPGVREKAPGDWVTEADVASENAVRAVLERETGLPVFGEEEGGERAEIGWLVDPLGGTSNFVQWLEGRGAGGGGVVGGPGRGGGAGGRGRARPVARPHLRGPPGRGRVPRRAPDPR